MTSEWTKLRDFVKQPIQGKVLDALELGSNQQDTATALGIPRGTVASIVRLLRRRFAQSGSPVPIIPKGHNLKGVSTLVNMETGKASQIWVKTQRHELDDKLRWEAIGKLITGLPQYKPTVAPRNTHSRLRNLFIVGDAHIGMLAQKRETGGADWDLTIATEVMRDAFERLCDRAPEADEAFLINVGDWLHHQDNRQTTPKSGHKLDGDSRFTKVAEVAVDIELMGTQVLLTKHRRVTIVNVPGNHDEDASRWMNLTVRHAFARESRVTVMDNARPQLYFERGTNLVGVMHGDGVPFKTAATLLRQDCREAYGRTKHARVIMGHHHSFAAEAQGDVLVEKYPTLAPIDMYAAHAGYRSERSMARITIDDLEGETERHKVFACR